jgi:apolipoprotein N-acyltransferase
MAAMASIGRGWVRYSWLWLALLVPSLVFSNGRWQLAVAALAFPFFARLFLFSQPVARGLLIFMLVQLGAYLIMWWEVIPAPGVLYYIIAAAYGACYFFPFVVDRVASGRIAGFASTLVLPLSWYLVEILIQLFTPYGSWSSAGYTQMGHGLLTPLAAWIGVSGVAFAAVWVASVASWFVMTTVPLRRRMSLVVIWAGSLVALIWLATTPPVHNAPASNTVEVAAITPSNEVTLEVSRATMAAREAGEFDAATLAQLKSVTVELNDGLITRSREAARNGARLVVWSETAGRVLDSQEGRLVGRGQELAREEGIYLFMGIGVFHPGSQPPLENKVIAIAPSGEVAWQYRKARPIVGSEAPYLPPGHNELATLDTPFGRIGLVICHDLDFADFVAQAGRKEVELLLAPSADWAVIDKLHATMGVMRAVENGFWLLRPAHDGLSLIASPQGEVTHSAYDTELEERVFTGQIPVQRIQTHYPHIRSYLPFIAMTLMMGLLVLAWRQDPS